MLLEGGDIALFQTTTSEPLGVIESSRYLSEYDYLVSIDFNSEGGAWVLSNGGMLLECTRMRQSCDQIDLTLLIPEADSIFFEEAIYTSPNRLTVSTESHGVYELDLTSLAISSLQPPPNSETANNQFDQVWALSASRQGEVWVATLAGLFGPTSEKRLAPYRRSDSFEQNFFVTQFESLDEGRLLALSPGELHLIRQTPFESYRHKDGLTSPITTTFAQSDDGIIYIGSIHGLSTFNPSSSKLEPLSARFPEADLIDNRIMSLLPDTEGMWLGGYEGGLRQLEYSSGRVNLLASAERNLSAVTQILSPTKERLLVGTPEHGIIVVRKSGEIIAEYPPHFGVTDSIGSFVISMIQSQQGNILIGTNSGVYELEINPGQVSPRNQYTRHYLDGEEVYEVVETSDGSIWAGTYQNGLYRSPAKRAGMPLEFQRVETSPALPDETINAIEEDDLGMLWLSTNRGLVRLDPSTYAVSIYNESDGLVDGEFNAGASLKDRDGFLYFGTASGFNRFDPRSFVERRIPPPLRLTEIMIHREPVPYDPAYVEIKELVLDHNDHSLDVEFSTMDIISPGLSRYKYRLENFDDDWVDIGTRNSATFTSLPAGQYLLRVIGANSKGVWNYDGIALPIRVLPAPWLTWWAFTLYALLVIALFTATKRFYDTHLAKVAATREAEDMKVTATLAMDDLQDQLEVENRLVDNLRKHATTTFDMVDELLTLELEDLYGDEVEESMGRARQRLECLQALEASVYFHGELLKVNFRDAIDRTFAAVIKAHPHPTAELVLANDCSEDLLIIDIAAPLVLLAHELILNSVLHAFPESRCVECIEVSFGPDASNWVFKLSDSGCGLPNAVDPDRPTTLGMELVARIIARLGATLEVNRNGGTYFRATMPKIDF